MALKHIFTSFAVLMKIFHDYMNVNIMKEALLVSKWFQVNKSSCKAVSLCGRRKIPFTRFKQIVLIMTNSPLVYFLHFFFFTKEMQQVLGTEKSQITLYFSKLQL